MSLGHHVTFARCCKRRTIPFFTLYGWWELKLRYCPGNVGLRYTEVLNPCSVRDITISRNEGVLSLSFSFVNWCGQSMKVSSTYLNHIVDFRAIDSNAISSKYSMYIFAVLVIMTSPLLSPHPVDICVI